MESTQEMIKEEFVLSRALVAASSADTAALVSDMLARSLARARRIG